jgi:Concanavalin A-like lectin/glucanases superfamily
MTGSDYNAIDTTGLALYYPMDGEIVNGISLSNYNTGLGINDASLNNNAAIVTSPIIGSGSLSLMSNASQTVSIKSFTLPPVPSTGNSSVGFSVSCWFDASGTQQSNNACLFSLRNAANLGISIFYNGTNNWLDISINRNAEVIPYTYPIPSNSWNFLVLTGSCIAGQSTTGATYTLYLNNVIIQTFGGAWPSILSSYSNNTIGYGGIGTSYFNGLIDDFRLYTRCLTVQDVYSLWNYAYTMKTAKLSNLIDSTALQVYYPFDQMSYTNYYAFATVTNGLFANPMGPANAISSANPSITGWTMSMSSPGNYYLCNGTIIYSYGLPSVVSQYVAVESIMGGGSATFSQVFPITGYSIGVNYFLSFVAFPRDGSYNALQTLTVSLGGSILLNNVSFVVSSSTVPYNTYNIPFTVVSSGNYALTFTVSNPESVVVPSTVCFTNISIVNATVPALGYSAVDPSALAIYYPFDIEAGINSNNSINNYATGKDTSVADGFAYFGATMGSTSKMVGSGYLELKSVYGQYTSTTKTISIGSSPVTGTSGFTVCGWMCPLGPFQSVNACIFSLVGQGTGQGTVQGNISMFFNRTLSNQYFLDFSCNGMNTPEYLSNYTITPNTWNFFAMTVLYTGPGATGTTYTYYVNDQSTTMQGAWPDTTTYTSLLLGQNASAGLGSYNGYLDDIRVYTRALSSQDVAAVWNYGTSSLQKYGNLIDPASMQVYYPFEQGTEVTWFDSFNTISLSNGTFTESVLVADTSSVNISIPGWSVILGTNATYVLYNGTTKYTYGLPTGITQYIAVSAGDAKTSTQISQMLSLVLALIHTGYTQYMLSFYVFPLDGVYNVNQKLSVSLGSIVLLNNVSFVAKSTSVPYTSFNIPVMLNYSGDYPLTFTFSNDSSVTSTLCIAGVSMVAAVNELAIVNAGYRAVDINGLAIYYPFDRITYSGTLLKNYATGQGIVDASTSMTNMVTSASDTNSPGLAQIGSTCLSLSRSNSQYATIASVTVPSATAGAGFSVAGWFYSSGNQSTNSTLFSFANTTGGSISCFYHGSDNWLDFSANPGTEYVAWSYRIVPNNWNFFACTIQANDTTRATYTYYLNDVCMCTMQGAWPDVGSSYTNNLLGYGSVSGSGYFNGYMDDFRVYTRTLSPQDVLSIWNFGQQYMGYSSGTIAYGNMVDPYGLQVYYPFTQGTMVQINQPSVTFTGYILDTSSITMNYTNPTTFYSVAIARNTRIGSGTPVSMNPSITSYTDSTGLQADTSYTYTIIPYSELGKMGTAITTGITSIIPSVTNAFRTFSDISSVSVRINFNVIPVSYYYMKIARITYETRGTGGVTGSYTTLAVGDTSFVDTGLAINAQYSYSMVPYNVLDISGNTMVVGPTCTLPRINTNIAYFSNITPNSTKINITVNSSLYSYMAIARITAGVTGDYSILNIGDTSFSDTGLLANREYSYSLVPYNTFGVSGDVIIIGPMTTLPQVTSNIASISDITATTAKVNLTVDPTMYSYMAIARVTQLLSTGYDTVDSKSLVMYYPLDISYNTTGVVGSYTTLKVGDTSFVDTGLLMNTQYAYSYSLIPYNTINVSGGLVSTNRISTLPRINTSIASFSNITANGAKINFMINFGLYSYLSIARITGATTGSYTNLNIGDTSFSDTGLAVDTSYSYSIIPYNLTDTPGTMITIGPILTLPQITSEYASFSNITKSSITVNLTVNQMTYSYLSIARITSGVVGSYTTLSVGATSFLDNGLSTNTVYSYSLIPYNVLNVSGGVVTTRTTSTLPEISSGIASFSNTTTTGTKINLVVNPSLYSYVAIARITGIGTGGVTGSYTQLGMGDTSYVDTGLAIDSSYTYSIIPYNTLDVSGTAVVTGPVFTLPQITSNIVSSFTNTTTSGTKLNITVDPAQYSYLKIARITAGVTGSYTQLLVGDTSYADTGLAANTYYTYSLIPYNMANVAGATVVSRSVDTLPQITSGIATFSDTSYSQTKINLVVNPAVYFYSYLSIARITGETGGVTGSYTRLGAGDTSYVDTGLAIDSSYTYSLIPYNADDVSGTSVVTGPVFTLPKITTGIVSSFTNTTSSSTKLNITVDPAQYWYMKIARISAGVTGSYTQLLVGDTSYVDTGMTANTSYSYSMIPYNTVNVSGGLVISLPVTTRPQISPGIASFSNITTTTAKINLAINPSVYFYSYVSIARITGGVTGSYMTLGVGDTSYVDTGLATDTSYAYSLIPYNILGVDGSAVIVGPVVTLPQISSTVVSSFSNITTTAAKINLVVNPAWYSYLAIARINGNTIGSYTYLTAGDTSYVDTGLAIDTSYNYSLVPYNVVNVSGGSIAVGPVVTLPQISSSVVSSFSNITTTTAKINLVVNPAWYSYLAIARITGNVVGTYTTLLAGDTSYVDTGLAIDTSYAYSLIPYNVLGVDGSAIVVGPVVTLPQIDSSVISSFTDVTSTSTKINLVVDPSKYNYLKIARITGGVTGSYTSLLMGDTYYVDTGLTKNTSYTYSVVPYNVVNVSGGLIISGSVTTLPDITANIASIASIGSITYNSITVNININAALYSYLSIARVTNGVTGMYYTLAVGSTSFVDQFIASNTQYSYSVIPYNSANAAGNPVTIGTATTLAYIDTSILSPLPTTTTSSVKINMIVNPSMYSYLAIARITGGVTGSYTNRAIGDTSFTDTGLSPSTNYSYSFVPYNSANVPGTAIVLGQVWTIPQITGVTAVISPTQITIAVQGSYNYIIWLNNVTGSSATLASGVTSFIDNSGLITGTPYTYTITPYNGNYVPDSGTPFITQSFVPSSPILNDISNGIFATPAVSSGSVSTLNPTIPYWTFSSGSQYLLYNGSGMGTKYSSGLPSTATQYVGILSGAIAGSVTKMTQSVYLSTTTMGTKFILSFMAFPLDGSYNSTHTLSVSIGNTTYLQNYSFTVSASSVPYTTFNYPFTISTTDTYNLTFTTTCPIATTSTIGITNIIIEDYTLAGVGYNAIDSSNLALYYAFDPSAGIVSSTLYDYASSVLFADGVVYNSAAIKSVIPMVGQGYLVLSSASSQYVSLGSVTLPSANSGNGITITGWFYSLGTQVNNAVIFWLNSGGSTSDGKNIGMFYYGTSSMLNFVVTGCSNYLANNVQVISNTWNFFAVTINYTQSGNYGTIYNYYLNNILIGTVQGGWPGALSYTNNSIGYASGMGYFNGYVDDFRVYKRILTVNDIASLWNYGTICTLNVPPNMIDNTSLVMYYNMDVGAISATPVIPYNVKNGTFTTPLLMTNATSNTNIALSNWTFSSGSVYNLYNGTVVYATTLPYYLSQYVGVQTSVGSQTVTMSQTITVANANQNLILTFYAFPMDNSYNAAHTVSVSIGQNVLMSNISLTASASTVPYTPFALPFTVGTSGTYILTFTFNNTTATTSTMCITNVQISDTTLLGFGYNNVDSTSLAMYYPFDVNTVSGTRINDYAGGFGILDASLNAGALISTANYTVGTGSLALVATSSQYVTLKPTFTMPVASASGVGASFIGWFYPSGAQSNNATLFNLSGTSGNISLYYNGTNAWLDFSANGGVEFIANTKPITPNVWNLFAYTIRYNGTNATHTYYINNTNIGSVTGNYPSTAVSYTNNTLGYGSGLGYFNGYIEEFRAYTRVLTANELSALWNSSISTYTSIIDTTGLKYYYPFNAGTIM